MKMKLTFYKIRKTHSAIIKKMFLFVFVANHISVFCQAWVQGNNIGTIYSGQPVASPPVSDALSLSAGGKIYVIGERTYTNITGPARLWEYDPPSDTWTLKSAYPGSGTAYLCGFSIGNIIYVGSGTGATLACSDFYKYNIISNTWTQIASIPIARRQASAFSSGSKGYVLCGESTIMSNYLKDLWEYDPITDNWSQKANFPGTGRCLASAFSSSGNGYFGLGFDGSSWHSDFYKYHPGSDTWTQTTSLPGQGRCGAGATVINNEGFILCGNKGMAMLNDCYNYKVDADIWTILPAFGGGGRTTMICGSSTNKIFAGGGSTQSGTVLFEDWWSFQTAVGIKTNLIKNNQVSIFRTSEHDLVLKTDDLKGSDCVYHVYDLNGKLILSGIISENESKIFIESEGMYNIVFESERIRPFKFINDKKN
jgi:hypothetical protein